MGKRSLSAIEKIAQDCRNEECIGVLTTGTIDGKSEAVRKYASVTDGVVVLETADERVTASEVFHTLHQRIGNGSPADLREAFENCTQQLAQKCKLLVVHGADHLDYKATEMLRRLHDKTNVGVLLVGSKQLLSKLAKPKSAYSQIWARVGYVATT